MFYKEKKSMLKRLYLHAIIFGAIFFSIINQSFQQIPEQYETNFEDCTDLLHKVLHSDLPDFMQKPELLNKFKFFFRSSALFLSCGKLFYELNIKKQKNVSLMHENSNNCINSIQDILDKFKGFGNFINYQNFEYKSIMKIFDSDDL